MEVLRKFCNCGSLWDLPLHHLPSYSHTNHAVLVSALILLLKVSNFIPSLPPPVLLTLARILFLLRIFILISGVTQGIKETDLLVFEGICLSAESRMNKIIKLKFFYSLFYLFSRRGHFSTSPLQISARPSSYFHDPLSDMNTPSSEVSL